MVDLSCKRHLELCLAEEDYSIGRSHCQLASLYTDFDQTLCDITQLQFYVKWKRPTIAAAVLERIVKSRTSNTAWDIIHKLFLKAASSETSEEKVLFTAISCDTFEVIIGGLTKRFDSGDYLKTKLLLFALRNLDANKFGKLLNRAITFLTERASNDKDLQSGIGRYHVYLAVIVVPVLLKSNFNTITVSRALSVVVTVLHVAIAWPMHCDEWTNLLSTISEFHSTEAQYFSEQRFVIAASLLDSCIFLYELGPSINIQTCVSGCVALTSCIDKTSSLKVEARKIAMLIFIWFAYCIWKNIVSDEEMLAWIPDDDWLMDVDKLISDKSELNGSPSKRPKLRERKVQTTTTQNKYLMSSQKELCDAYELCSSAIRASSIMITAPENLHFAIIFKDIKQFISESLIFKRRLDTAITYMCERIEDDEVEKLPKMLLHFHLAIANCFEKNWSDACDNVIAVFSFFQDRSEKNAFSCKCEEAISSHVALDCSPRSVFKITKKNQLAKISYDLSYHILFRVYTSTSVDHENDQLLGALLVLSQIDFACKGFRCFNRIMRHVEAKGSLKCAGLVKYINNVAILEELARIQDYCAEYVSVQIAVPQIQRRIGQSTRHSVRGTKDGQKQSLEEQIKRCNDDPCRTVLTYFLENREAILKMLGGN